MYLFKRLLHKVSTMENVPKDVHKLLQTVARNEGITKPSFTLHDGNKKEDGYMGNLYFVTIHDKESSDKREVVVKKAVEDNTVRDNFPIDKVYSNECLFYKSVFPTVVGDFFFNKLPIYYGSDLTCKQEKLVLENLKLKNFKVMNKRLFYDKEHLELILTEYGKFHGLSMANKQKYTRMFQMHTKKLYDYWSNLEQMPILEKAIELTMQECYEYLSSESKTAQMAIFKKYIQNGVEEFEESSTYYGTHSVLLHGDCWSNNIMLKYDENSGKPIDLRFIDFQLTRVGTPVFDVSYLIYSGGTADIFKDLDYYLRVYHDSLSETLTSMDCNPKAIYPFDFFKEEWRIYSKFGFFMGLMLLKGKLVYENEGMAMSEIVDNAGNMREAEAGKYDKEAVKMRSLDLIEHMFKNKLL